jgi:hypothetical protein
LADFGNGQLDGEWLPIAVEVVLTPSMGLYGTARMEGDAAMKVGRGIRVGVAEVGSRGPICNMTIPKDNNSHGSSSPGKSEG